MERNEVMAERIERAPVSDPVRFVVAGDSGAWADPTADGIYAQRVDQVAHLDPAPVFFANLGDFAGPGTVDATSTISVSSSRSPSRTSASSATTTSTTRMGGTPSNVFTAR
jgi:hypothetical protein